MAYSCSPYGESLLPLQADTCPRLVTGMKVIGITGTIGAGKGTVVDYLTKPPHGYLYAGRATVALVAPVAVGAIDLSAGRVGRLRDQRDGASFGGSGQG